MGFSGLSTGAEWYTVIRVGFGISACATKSNPKVAVSDVIAVWSVLPHWQAQGSKFKLRTLGTFSKMTDSRFILLLPVPEGHLQEMIQDEIDREGNWVLSGVQREHTGSGGSQVAVPNEAVAL